MPSLWGGSDAADNEESKDAGASAWEELRGQEARGNNDEAFTMSASNIGACRAHAEECGFGAFVVIGNKAYFRPEPAASCRAKLSANAQAVTHLHVPAVARDCGTPWV